MRSRGAASYSLCSHIGGLLPRRRYDGWHQQVRDQPFLFVQSERSQAVRRSVYQVRQRCHNDLLDVMHLERGALTKQKLLRLRDFFRAPGD